MVSLKTVMPSESKRRQGDEFLGKDSFKERNNKKMKKETRNGINGSDGCDSSTGWLWPERCHHRQQRICRRRKRWRGRFLPKELLKATDYKVEKYVGLNDYMNMTVELSKDYTVSDADIQSYTEYLMSDVSVL